MPTDNDSADEPALFCALITPHRSLGRVGFRVLMLTLGGASLIAGTVFLLAGAWPVFGFFGLDVLAVYIAMRVSYRAARAYEEVRVTPSELTVRQVSHRGRVGQWRFNPVWVRLDRERHEEFGLTRLFLVSRGIRLAVAHFLSPPEKERFASALGAALVEARRGPTRSTP